MVVIVNAHYERHIIVYVLNHGASNIKSFNVYTNNIYTKILIYRYSIVEDVIGRSTREGERILNLL